MNSLPRPVRLLLPRLLVLGVLALAGCSSSDYGGGTPNPSGSASAEFVIHPGAFDDGPMAFDPPVDTVHVGQVVRVRNGDSLVHTINTRTPGGPGWGTLSPGNSVDRTMTTAGPDTFECKVPGHVMSGIVVVLP